MDYRFLALIPALLCALQAWGQPAPAIGCEQHLQRRSYRQDIRRSFIKKYAEKIYASEGQNQTYIDLVLSGAPRAHVVAEFSLLKTFNRVLNDKDLVTAITNFHKEMVIEEINKRLPDLPYSFYSDFKSIRLAIPLPADARVYELLEQAFAEANRRFYASSVIGQITRGIDRSHSWFQMGISRGDHESADRAALAARFARIDGGLNSVRSYEENVVQENLENKLAVVKSLHEEAVGLLRPLGLAERSGLALEVFAEARKSKTEGDLRVGLSRLASGREVSEKTAALVSRYIHAVDEFSPNMLVAKRENLMIHDAPFGAVSLDFIGLGAENLKATAKALIEARDLDDAVRRARIEEREVTRRFVGRKAMVEKAALEFFAGQASVRFSGDDGIIIPRREFLLSEQLQFVRKLAELLPRPFFRMVVIGADGAAAANSSELITYAESMEKKLRGLMLERMGTGLSNVSHFEVLVLNSGVERKVVLVLGVPRKLLAEEQNSLKILFPKAVQAIEEEARGQDAAVSYEALDIYSTGGR